MNHVTRIFLTQQKTRYEKAIRKSSFNEKLKYKNKDTEEQTRNEEKKK